MLSVFVLSDILLSVFVLSDVMLSTAMLGITCFYDCAECRYAVYRYSLCQM